MIDYSNSDMAMGDMRGHVYINIYVHENEKQAQNTWHTVKMTWNFNKILKTNLLRQQDVKNGKRFENFKVLKTARLRSYKLHHVSRRSSPLVHVLQYVRASSIHIHIHTIIGGTGGSQTFPRGRFVISQYPLLKKFWLYHCIPGKSGQWPSFNKELTFSQMEILLVVAPD